MIRYSFHRRKHILSSSAKIQSAALFLVIAGLTGMMHAQSQRTITPGEALAATPPMGWSTWNHFHHDISDALVRAQADAMVSSGMRDAGYVYVNIDGGWEGERDANGVLHPNSNFPDMKALGDYIHSKGLKFGMYTGPGPKTCGGAPASYGHEAQDAKMFASWGVDYLKYDLCSFREVMARESGADGKTTAPSGTAVGFSEVLAHESDAVVKKSDAIMRAAYEKMHQALLQTGRPIVFSMCQYGYAKVWQWGPQVGGNLWRTSGDVSANYGRVTDIGFGEAGLARYAGPGHWNDPDILEVGNGTMTPDESRTNFSLWAILAAPLLAGNDLANMTPETKSILLNKEVIAVDQDPLGKQGDRAYETGPLEVWSKPLSGGDLAIGLFNEIRMPTEMTLKLADVGWHGPAAARDLWTHSDIGVLRGEYTVMVPAHGVVMLRLSHPAK
ncbi:MAG: glycoside hydrolase family 27 protein [Terriglobia bacterium]|nr:glycoside hydrolase family 27 protein [Terriglobia bacterium]